jgi:ParB-like chromosome segregation protein Spo0J
MFSENDEREDLSPIDRGMFYKRLMEVGHKSQYDLADDFNKAVAHISQYVAAAELTGPVREGLKRFNPGIGIINQIVRLNGNEAKIAMLDRCQKEGLSVKQLENIVNKALIAFNAAKSYTQHEGFPTQTLAKAGFRITQSGNNIYIKGSYPKPLNTPIVLKDLEASISAVAGSPR